MLRAGSFITVVVSCGALAALPPLAAAQNGFPDYRQAAADQYPAQPPPATGASSTTTGGSSATAGSSGKPTPVATAHAHPKTSRSTGAGRKPAAAGATGPVAVPTRPLPAATGSLPFTGSDLSGLVVLALALVAGGLLLAAATRRRRRRAPA